ncbi:glycosyltransferase [Synechococcus sp. MIT S9503]|uniref:glycosyltransferase n=1 Tax=Synechococcus sp. MIT S9503 TaxID=3082547 RepID=UPI0039A6E9EB
MADFVVLATADWDHPLWTNKQHTALTLAAAGHRVLYVESLGIRPPRVGAADCTRIVRRLRRLLQLPRQRQHQLWVWSPPVLPGGHSGRALQLNRLLLKGGLELVCRWLGFTNPILWTYNPLTTLYLDPESFAGSVYHCVDRIQDQPGMPVARIEASEQALSRAVGVVFATSPQLQVSHRQWNHHTLMFGNVADHVHFSRARLGDSAAPLCCPERLVQVDRPRLVFMGAIDAYKLDLDLLLQLVKRCSAWSFVLIGPVGECDPSTDVASLQACSNVELVGPVPYADLPGWLAHADVALLPLKVNGYTRHMFPMKFFEYLSSGLPVVATEIPALEVHADVAWLCPPEVESFEQAIHAALAGEGPSLQQRLERAATQTYEVRTASMLDYLDRVGLLAEAQRNQADSLRTQQFLLQRSAIWLRGLSSRVLVALSHRLMRGGHPRAAVKVLQGVAESPWSDCLLQGGLVLPLVRCGDYRQARLVMEKLWQIYGHVGELKQLLFRRGNRPSERSQQVLLFEELVTSSVLPLYALNYCQVVLAHRCVDVKDDERMCQSALNIAAMASALEQDPGTLICLRSNRRNRSKLLVSCYATLLRLYLGLQQFDDLGALGMRCLTWAESLNLEAIDADTSYRLTRNILRVLLVNVLEAWTQHDHALMQRSSRVIARVHNHCHRRVFDQQSAQENHRGFADAVLERVQLLEHAQHRGDSAGDAEEALPSLMLLMLKSERELVSELIRQEHLNKVLPLFSPYLAGVPL